MPFGTTTNASTSSGASATNSLNTLTSSLLNSRNSGLTVHDILGKSIVTNPWLAGISNEALEHCKLNANTQTAGGLSNLLQSGVHIERSHAETLTARKTWRATKLINPERFTIEEACSLAKRAADDATALAEAREALANWGVDELNPL